MEALIAILLWLLLAVLILICLALITPVFVRFRLTTSPQFAYRIDIRAFAGLAPRLTVAKGPGDDPTAKRDAMPKPKQHGRPRLKRVRASVIRAVPSLIEGIVRRIHLAELDIDADYGLGDPADTGRLCGLLMPLQYAIPTPSSISLDLRPDFTKPCLNGNMTAVVRVTVAAMCIPVTRFAWRAFGPQR